MAQLAISLFGCFRAARDGIQLTGFVSDKGRALLAYLAVEAGWPHRREALAALLWPDKAPPSARNNLRQVLHHLRQSMGDRSGKSHYLLVSPQEIQFNRRSDYWLDVAAFDQALTGCWRHHPGGSALCEGCLEGLRSAIDLYHGDLLDGFTLRGCPQFEWWLLSRQEVYHSQAIEALDFLVLNCELNQDYPLASHYAQRAIELEPWRERAYRQRMRALALGGQRSAALRQYEICRQILADELGVEPTPKTVRLFEQLRAGALPASEVHS